MLPPVMLLERSGVQLVQSVAPHSQNANLRQYTVQESDVGTAICESLHSYVTIREHGSVLYLGMAQEFWDFAKLAMA